MSKQFSHAGQWKLLKLAGHVATKCSMTAVDMEQSALPDRADQIARKLQSGHC